MIYKLIVGVLLTCAAVASSRAVQDRIDEMREQKFEEDLLYLPNDKMLNYFTAGLDSVVADILWLKTIQYTVMEFHNVERKFTWLEHMCNTVVKLDPHFEDAYVYGGMLLAAIGADEEALKLLKGGLVNNPYSWEIPFEIAKVYLLNRRDRPESSAVVVHYLRMVAERSDHPGFYLEWIRRIDQQKGLKDEARAIWEDVLRNNDDEFIREIAEVNLLDLTLREEMARLDEAVATYAQRLGQAPETLSDLVSSEVIPSLPRAEGQGHYFLGADGTVKNTLVLNSIQQKLATRLNGEVHRFKNEMGRYPESLEALVQWNESTIPRHPYDSRQWIYDPKTGTVN